MLILHLVDPDPPGPPPTQSAAGQARAGEQWELSEWSLGAAAGPTMATLALGFGGSGGAAGAGPLVLAHGIRPSPARDGPALRCGTALEASSRSAPWPWTSGPAPPSSSPPRALLRRRRRVAPARPRGLLAAAGRGRRLRRPRRRLRRPRRRRRRRGTLISRCSCAPRLQDAGQHARRNQAGRLNPKSNLR